MQRIFSLMLAVFAVVAAVDVFPNSKLYGMSGFAKKGGTTGGSKGKMVAVKNLQELQKYISDAVPRTLVITANIRSPKKVTLMLGSNKSIIGSWKSNVIQNVYFHTSRKAGNIIFQNLVFIHDAKNIANGDTQLILEFGKRYWIDHCTFDGQHVNRKDLGKLLKVSTVDYVTISYCKFINHFFGLILGYPSDAKADIAKNNNYPRLTIMFNYFENIKERAPGLMRFGMFHVYNNYINNCPSGFTVSFQCKIYSEFNYFSDQKNHLVLLDDKGDGFFRDAGSVNMPKKQISKVDRWRPSMEYRYKAKTPNYSRNFCRQFSGAQNRKLHFVPDN